VYALGRVTGCETEIVVAAKSDDASAFELVGDANAIAGERTVSIEMLRAQVGEPTVHAIFKFLAHCAGG
jgi:hypothetical protein